MDSEAPTRTVRDKTFLSTAVALDDTRFIDCKFVDCLLTYSGGGPFLLEGTRLGDSVIEFSGHAEATLRVLQALCQSGHENRVERLFDAIRWGGEVEQL